MSEEQISFPELDEAVEKYVKDLTSKNIEILTLKNEVRKISDDLYVKSVLLTDSVDLISYSQICLAKNRYYTPLDMNRMGYSNIMLYMEYLDKKNAPS